MDNEAGVAVAKKDVNSVFLVKAGYRFDHTSFSCSNDDAHKIPITEKISISSLPRSLH